MDDIKEVAVVLTSGGFKHPSKEPVHFSPQYGNQINLKESFSGKSLNDFHYEFLV